MIDKVVEYFQENGVICKKVEDPSPDYGDFIAIFGYGNLTRKEIVKRIRDNNLLCIFFESAIQKNGRERREYG